MPFRFATIYTRNRKSLIYALRRFQRQIAAQNIWQNQNKTDVRSFSCTSRVKWKTWCKGRENESKRRERILFGSFEGKQKVMMRCRWGRASLAHYSNTANHNGESPWFLGTITEGPGECRIYASQFTCVWWELWISLQRPHRGSPQSSLRVVHKACCFILLIRKALDFNTFKKRYVWYQISYGILKGLYFAGRNTASRCQCALIAVGRFRSVCILSGP